MNILRLMDTISITLAIDTITADIYEKLICNTTVYIYL